MTEEQQCYYMVRDDGSATFYLHGGNSAHLVLTDTLDASAQLAKRDATIAELRAQIATLVKQLTERDAMIAERPNMIVFPGVTFTPDQIAALHPLATRMFDAEALIPDLRAQIAERNREIAELRAAIVRLCGNAKTTLDLNEWLETYAPEQWFAGYDVAESALMALKDYSESIVYLHAQVATLTERLSRCTCTDDFGNVTG